MSFVGPQMLSNIYSDQPSSSPVTCVVLSTQCCPGVLRASVGSAEPLALLLCLEFGYCLGSVFFGHCYFFNLVSQHSDSVLLLEVLREVCISYILLLCDHKTIGQSLKST